MDKEFYDGVFNFTLDFEKYYKQQKKQIFDESDAIKYYSLDLIKKAILKFMKNEIDYHYFTEWCYAYYSIITMAYDLKLGIKSFIYDEISWTIDGLTFTNEKVSRNEGKKWIRKFELLDDIFQTNDWKAFYAIGTFADFNDDQNVLFYNDKKKIFTIIYMDHIENGYTDQDIIFLNYEELIEKIKNYKEHYQFYEYQKVKYLDENIQEALKNVKKC